MSSKKSRGEEFLSELKLYSDYLKWDDNLGRYETWREACDKILQTHIMQYGEKVRPYIDKIKDSLYKKEFLASQRNLQFRGELILKNNAKLYNCCTTYAYAPDVFNKGFFVLLSGTGLGVSLKNKYISKLPAIHKRGNDVKLFVVPDSIEGWADASKVLISSFCKHPSLLEEYFGHQILFDYSLIRPKGAFISGGFKAPSHVGLKQSLERIESLLNEYVGDSESKPFKSIIAYDIFMHLSDAVLSGGVRRSAMNVIIDEDDQDMINAKLGNWRQENPHRARSNNSVGLIRGKFSKDKFENLVSLNQGDNDLGFVFMSDEDEIFNPCFTINQRILTEDGWRTFGELLDKEVLILQDNRVIGKLNEKNEEIWDINLDATGVTKNIAKRVRKTGENQPIYKLKLNCGRELEATGNHHIATKRGMIELQKLEIGDEVLVGMPDNSYIPNNNSIDWSIGFLYGLFYGDGTKSKNTIFLDIWDTGLEYPMIEFIENEVYKVIAEHYSIEDMIGNTKINPKFKISKKTDKYVKYRLQSTLLTKIFELFNLSSKCDLDNIMYQSKDLKSGLLSGLLFTDGHIDYNEKSKSVSIRLTQSNESALQTIQLILQELGIFSKIYKLHTNHIFKDKAKDYICKDSFRLCIPFVENCIKARETILLYTHKKQKLDSIINNLSYKRKTKLYSKVKNISYIKNEDVYCLEENNRRTLIVEGITARRCYEIGFNFYNKIVDYLTAVFQFCNLNEINASACVNSKGDFDENKFYDLCEKAAILGTLQAGYTSFPYLGWQTEEIVKGEALLGISITGWMARPELFNPEILSKGAKIVKDVNEEVANFLGIKTAARSTTVKPSGNASVILQTPSGIHPDHARRYFRIMQLNKEAETAKYLEENMPEILEDSKWSSTGTDYVVYLPFENSEKTIVKKDMQGVKHLELIKLVQEYWVSQGKREDRCYNPQTNHNVSNTVIIDNIQSIVDYIYENKDSFTAVSFVSAYMDKDYTQAPMTSVLDTKELVDEYGSAAIFASGLIVDGLHYFNGDLWNAVLYVSDKEQEISGTREQTLLRKDWVRRVKKFAKNYFKGDLNKTIYCLKDVHLWHKWQVINRTFKSVDFSQILTKPQYTEVNKIGAIACSGGQCEIQLIG